MDVQTLIEQELGIKTTYRINPLVSAVGTSATLFLRNNSRRLGFIFVNLGVTLIYILNHPSVATTKGIVCTASGGGKVFGYKEDFILPTYEWYGISSGACNCMVVEILMI